MQSLAGLGKRLLLVLNKRDCGELRRKNVSCRCCARVARVVSPLPMWWPAVHLQSIPQPGQPLQPMPDVSDLLQRLAGVLHAEGEELIADNILLQCRSLDSRGRDLLNDQRSREAKRCIDRYSWMGAGIVAANLPGVDL